jgi:predicted DNA-binding transcriptional regulator AlpA
MRSPAQRSSAIPTQPRSPWPDLPPQKTSIKRSAQAEHPLEGQHSVSLSTGPPSTHKLVEFEELAAYGIRFSRVHVARLEQQGRFPRRVVLGGPHGNFVAWVESEIRDYVESLLQARDLKHKEQPAT